MALFLLVGIGTYLLLFSVLWIAVVLGLYQMAKHAGIPNPWLALLPYGNGYVMGLLAERSIYTYTGKARRVAFWTVLLQVLASTGAFFTIPLALSHSDFNGVVAVACLLLFGAGLAALVVFWYALYYIFKDYAPDNVLLYFLLGIFFNIYWIFLLVERNTVPVSVAGPGPYPYGRPKYDKYHRWYQPQPPGYPPQGGQGYYQDQPPVQNGQSYGGQPYGSDPRQPPDPDRQFYQGQGYYRPPERPQSGPEDRDRRNDRSGPEL